MKGRCTDVKETREWPLDCWLYLERVSSPGCCHHLKFQGQHLHCLKQENHFLATMGFAASCKKTKKVGEPRC